MNKYSPSFLKCWTHRFQLSFVSALIAQSLGCAVAQASPGGLLSNNDGATALAPVAAYNFDEGSGATVNDVSGNGITGAVQGAAWTTEGRYGGALSFDGFGYVDLGNPALLQITGSMTWSAWVKAAADPADDGNVIAKSDFDSGWQFKTTRDTGPHTFGVGVSSGPGVLAQRYSTTVRSLDVWYHVAGVYNAVAQTLDIYVNGVLDNGALSGTVPASQVNAPVSANIGRRSTGFNFIGIIDNVRIYDRPLDQTEIQADMNTPIGCLLGPGYWKNHSQAWCMATIQIGCQTYTQAQAIAILRHNGSRDKTYSLAHQLIAAKLNIACKHSTSSCITSALAVADSFLCAHPVGSGVTANSSAWRQIKATHERIGNYNDGELCAPSCNHDDDDDDD